MSNVLIGILLLVYIGAGFVANRRDTREWEIRGYQDKPYQMNDHRWKRLWGTMDKPAKREVNRAIRHGERVQRKEVACVAAEGARRQSRELFVLTGLNSIVAWLALGGPKSETGWVRIVQSTLLVALVVWIIVCLAFIVMARRAERANASLLLEDLEPRS